MMGRPIEDVVYDQLFHRPRSSDPQNFQAFLQRCLIPEIRQETLAFYGHIDTQEARYPGLDYEHPTHRMRLSRWPWHRRLFRAFDALRLTHFEIIGLTKWEGTKWAKEQFEQEQGITISDTTDDGFPTWQEAATWDRPAAAAAVITATAAEADSPAPSLRNSLSSSPSPISSSMFTPPANETSIVDELNALSRAHAARLAAGESNAVLDEEWAVWIKTAIESGRLLVPHDLGTGSAPHYTLLPIFRPVIYERPARQEAANWDRPAAAVTAAAAVTTATDAEADSPTPSLRNSLSSSPISSGMSTPPFQPADEDDDDDEESEDELESVGVELNARLRTQAARRDAGDRNAVLDEAWEDWLNTAIESGELAVVTEQIRVSTGGRASPPSAALPAALVPTGMLDLARAGQWTEIPASLQPMLRNIVRGEETPAGPSSRHDPALPATATPRALIGQLTASSVAPRFP